MLDVRSVKHSDLTRRSTLAEVQHLAEVISSDKSRLRAYCELGKLHDETQQAVEEKDADAIRSPPRLTVSNNNSVLSMTRNCPD